MNPLSVLIVDSHPDAGPTAAALRVHGYEVRAAGSVAGAVREVFARDPDVLVFDPGLPDGDGRELIDTARAVLGYQPLAVGTTAGVGGERVCRRAGCDLHVPKPVDAPALIALLDGYARRLPARRAGEVPPPASC